MKAADLMKHKPIYILRQEQYEGLLFCWRIRTGLKKGLEHERIKKYVDWFFCKNLDPHFDVEENFIFPLLKNNEALIKRACANHRRLRRLIGDIGDLPKNLSLLEEELEAYFLFERQKLVYEIQNTIPERELGMIMRIHGESLSYEDWGDEFWQ